MNALGNISITRRMVAQQRITQGSRLGSSKFITDCAIMKMIIISGVITASVERFLEDFPTETFLYAKRRMAALNVQWGGNAMHSVNCFESSAAAEESFIQIFFFDSSFIHNNIGFCPNKRFATSSRFILKSLPNGKKMTSLASFACRCCQELLVRLHRRLNG